MTRLSEILEVPVSTLLGSAIPDDEEPDEIAAQLARINEQLAVKNRRSRRIWRIVAIILIAVVIVNLLLIAVGVIAFDKLEVTGSNSNRETSYIETITEEWKRAMETIHGSINITEYRDSPRV